MTKLKTSLWIAKLSKDGKTLMHEFLKNINQPKDKIPKLDISLSQNDIEALSVIFSRLQLQKKVDEINAEITKFNNTYKINIDLAKKKD